MKFVEKSLTDPQSGEFLHQWRIFAPSIILTMQNPIEVRLAIEVGCIVAFEPVRDAWGKRTATVVLTSTLYKKIYVLYHCNQVEAD